MSSFILQHSAVKSNSKPDNGRKAEAFEQAFIPTKNNRIEQSFAAKAIRQLKQIVKRVQR